MEPMTENGAELIADFVEEATDSLRDLPVELDRHRENPSDPAAINAVFRAVHSIKGCAGFLGIIPIKSFSHTLENTMDDVRNGKLDLSENLARGMVEAFDVLEEMLQRSLDGQLDEELKPNELDLLDRISEIADGCGVSGGREDEILQDLQELAEELASVDFPQAAEWATRVAAIEEKFRAGDDESGEGEEDLANIAPRVVDFADGEFRVGTEEISSRLAPLFSFLAAAEDGEYTDKGGEAFLEATEQLEKWASSHGHEQLREAAMTALNTLRTLIGSPLDVEASLVMIVWDGLYPQLSELRVDDQPEEVASQETPPKGEAAAAAPKVRQIRVKEERVDQFLGDVSSLFITCELFKDLHARLNENHEGDIRPLVEEMRQINTAFAEQSATLQKSVVELRQIPISGLFAKFPRMVRTLASQLEKKIDVVMEGEQTEIDKSLVDDLDAPLTHMIRNAVDHGIDTVEQRLARGLGETGTITLRAETTRTHVIVTIEDNGRGIDPNFLREKIVSKGIMTTNQVEALSDQEAVELIFHPGFSTAEKLSEVSGRGVGMDVVRTNLREHNGEIAVKSVVGVGSTFRMEIPIREAVLVIDGLMLQQSGANFVLPFEHIREISEIPHEQLKSIHGTSHVVTIRGVTYDAVRLSDVLDLPPTEGFGEGLLQVIVVGYKETSFCLMVDQVLAHRQVVVNSLTDVMPGIDNLAGVAQLGGGRLALVLSVPDILKGLLSPRKASAPRSVPAPKSLASPGVSDITEPKMI